MDEGTLKSQINKSKGIDGLRGLCCIGIVIWHVYANGNYSLPPIFSKFILPSFNELVYLFMMISAYGICNGYYEKVKNGTFDFEMFYRRRFRKLWPFFAALVLFDIVLEHSFNSLAEGFIELTMMFGYLPSNQLDVIGVAWTLGVIFLFYIAFPYFVFLTATKKRAWFSFGVSIIAMLFCKMYLMTGKFVGTDFNSKHSFLFCVPFFLSGCIVYLYKCEIVNRVSKYEQICGITIILGLIFSVFINQIDQNNPLWEISLMAIYLMVLCLAIGTKSVVLCNSSLSRISVISMEIYLSHMVCFRILEKLHVLHLFGKGFISYIISIFVIFIVLLMLIPIINSILDSIIEKVVLGKSK